MVGNGVTNWKFDADTAYVASAYQRGLLGNDLHNKALKDLLRQHRKERDKRISDRIKAVLEIIS